MPLPRRGGVARVPEQMAGSSKVVFVETAPAALGDYYAQAFPLNFTSKSGPPRGMRPAGWP